MQVIQLIGRYAGHLVDMNYAEAQSNIGNGTAVKPANYVPVKGIDLSDDAKAAIGADAVEAPKAPAKKPAAKEPAKKKAPAKKPAAKRAHEPDGTFTPDDPRTPKNEAFVSAEGE